MFNWQIEHVERIERLEHLEHLERGEQAEHVNALNVKRKKKAGPRLPFFLRMETHLDRSGNSSVEYLERDIRVLAA